MLKSIQAIIDGDGTVHLLERPEIAGRHMAILTILDESVDADPAESDSSTSDHRRQRDRVVRETAGLWAGRHGDGLDYVRKLRAEWGAS
jgi:hypothetical protein